ncbi:MAG: hypothetical protein ACLFSQ_06010 [Candidatus Zixiibacteriota bacterium]
MRRFFFLIIISLAVFALEGDIQRDHLDKMLENSHYSFYGGGSRLSPGLYTGLVGYGSFGSVYSYGVSDDAEHVQTLWSAGGGPFLQFYNRDAMGGDIFIRVTGEYWSKNYEIEDSDYQVWEYGFIIDPTIGYEAYFGSKYFLRFGFALSVFGHHSYYGLDFDSSDLLHSKVYLSPKAIFETGIDYNRFRLFAGVSGQYWRSDNTLFYLVNNRSITPKSKDLGRIYGRGYFGIQIGGF